MPKRTDISSIMIIGAGPIVIGQACEFDYSGRSGLQGAARRRGIRIILVNSNPATIMTDPRYGRCDLHVEPITPEIVARIIEKERPDALACPRWGGRPGLNTALALEDDQGVLHEVWG